MNNEKEKGVRYDNWKSAGEKDHPKESNGTMANCNANLKSCIYMAPLKHQRVSVEIGK